MSRSCVVLVLALALSACDGPAPVVPEDGGPVGLAVLGNGTHDPAAVDITVIADGASGLNGPRDVAFAHDATQLWVLSANRSVTIITNPGGEQGLQTERGFGGEHFMPNPSALAFGENGFMATAHETDEITQASTPADFMGPTLWTTDPMEFEAGHASHYDMLHNSPNAVGIAWESAHVYWIFDGYHTSLTRYDFGAHHGAGGEDHSDGIIARYVEGQVGYIEDVAAHMELDRASGLLYAADPANGRIAVLDTRSGERGATIGPNYDGAEMYAVENATLTTLVDTRAHGLERPSGLVLRDGVVYVGDDATSRIAAFDTTGALLDWIDLSSQIPAGSLTGLEMDAEGRLYACDFDGSRLLRIAPRVATP